ncbi:hypothetical protein [Candidatus Uabimicrobium sp. HlEnr_7]|uniref:ATP-dependent DNA ligase n=1 Tax=Candidatus Uabimicrobium helgolandensis TaxID=3095367 RepID=UPI00355838B0
MKPEQITIIDDDVIREYSLKQGLIASYVEAQQGLGITKKNKNYAAELLNIPVSLAFALENIVRSKQEQSLDSISFFSLLYGLYLPLSGMNEQKIAQTFGIFWKSRAGNNQGLVSEFLHKDIGLSLEEKINFLMGDPFSGKAARMGQDTLINVLASIRLVSHQFLRSHLSQIADFGLLFTEEVSKIKSDPPVTAKEVIVILRNLPRQRTNRKKQILRDLLERCGKLERYFLTRLILRRLHFGYEYRSSLVHSVLAQQHKISEEIIGNSIALSDIFNVCRILETQGPKGLEKLVLKPLNPVSPALAGTIEVTKKSTFPLWVECKYDGIRLMLHKDTSINGRVKYAAFTRRKNDWINLVPELEISAKWLQSYSFILDGELHGTYVDLEKGGIRPANVYDVYRYLQGNYNLAIKLQYVVFDILFMNGKDLTKLPWYKRRQVLEKLVMPTSGYQTNVPIVVAEGWEAKNYSEFKKWFKNFENRGYEGAMAKIIKDGYALGKRNNSWLKKKPAIYLDLAVTGALWSTTDRGPKIFSTFLLSCKNKNKYEQIARAEGLAYQQNYEMLQRITYDGLLTGENVEIRTSTATRYGFKLIPSIVVTIRVDGVVKDSEGIYSLRDPKIVCVRPRGDMIAEDVNTHEDIVQLYIKTHLK